ncbi:MAG: hypothetical protein Q4C55_02420 [Eubacterium sp.]|nr:hypothetical protein [Eubacterium sp.]
MNEKNFAITSLRVLLITTGAFVLFIRWMIGSYLLGLDASYDFSEMAYFLYLVLCVSCFINAACLKKYKSPKSPKSYRFYQYSSLLILILALSSLAGYFDSSYVYDTSTGYNSEFFMSFGYFGEDFFTVSLSFTLLYYAMNLSVALGFWALLFLRPEKTSKNAKKKTASAIPQTPKKRRKRHTGAPAFNLKPKDYTFAPKATSVPVTYSTKVDTTTQIDIFDRNDHFFTRHTRDDIF